ncbi:MAG: 3-phosphoglycerate dehydrogenase family protein [Gammaproteobacteria bacterium]|nr:3-phosphoglycerate dehydrogenase family protein [Gammaproteobacteria bacterium]MDE0450151.1 3-phosphoglycerate dehydrogenase family protein [Gammaproteobacteria bacterium]
MYRVKTYNQIAARGLELFPADAFRVGAEVAAPDAILLRSHVLTPGDLGQGVRAVARAGAGVNNIPVGDCTERGVVVFNTPGANANSVKELTIAALLLGSRDVIGSMDYVKTLSNVADDQTMHDLVEGEKRRFKGQELFARTLGVLGLGNVGSQVARAALDLGMRVIGFDPALSVDAAWRIPSEIQRMEDARSLFSQSDYVTVHIPSLPTTQRLINDDALRAFRRGAVLLNFARQEVVDEDDIAAALVDGTLSAYFSDFPSTKLAKLDNAHATPHLGASTVEAEENCAVMAAEQLRDFLSFGNIRNSVNFPDVNLELSFGYRLAVANRNVAGTLGQVLSVLADDNVNVIDMINKSRENVAYNLIDIEQPPTPSMTERINAIDSVINLRVFDAPGQPV